MSASNPPSPTSRRRRSSHFENRTPSASLHSRRSSQTSTFSHRRTASRASDNPLSPPTAGGEELGDSLADELAGAWDDGEDESTLSDAVEAGAAEPGLKTPQPSSPVDSKGGSSDTTTANGAAHTSPNKQNGTTARKLSATRHSRNRSLYDGSEYGDFEEEYSSQAADFSKELEMAMKDVEKLATQGDSLATAKGGPAADTVATLLGNLQNLGNQSSLETHATRLITAHTSLTSHLAFQTRALQTVSFPLLSPLSAPAPPEMAEELLPMLGEALALLPQPSHTALNSLAHLSTTSREAIASLSALSDSLHMCRQIESTAARRLKSAREGVAEMRREYAAAEQARLYIAHGDLDRRLGARQAATECRDIVSGFEQKCGQMRERLAASASASAAG